jgi:ketosteroid isomerase-like protein
MPGEGESLVRRAWDAINGNQSANSALSDLDGLFDPEIEYVNPPDAVERGTRRGPEGMRAALESWYGGAGPEGRFEIQQLIERGDMVFVRGRTHARGASSGIEVAGTGVGILYTIRDDRIRRVEWHWDQEEALARFEQANAS